MKRTICRVWIVPDCDDTGHPQLVVEWEDNSKSANGDEDIPVRRERYPITGEAERLALEAKRLALARTPDNSIALALYDRLREFPEEVTGAERVVVEEAVEWLWKSRQMREHYLTHPLPPQGREEGLKAEQ